jgi:hypothetical protein
MHEKFQFHVADKKNNSNDHLAAYKQKDKVQGSSSTYLIKSNTNSRQCQGSMQANIKTIQTIQNIIVKTVQLSSH